MRFIILFIFTLFCFLPVAKALEVGPDKPLMIKLREDASSIIVGNPQHAAVNLESSRMLIVNAGVPGATNLLVLGEGGKVLLDEPLIVNGAAPGYVRIKNACINADGACNATQMYYCEPGDACHNVNIPQGAPAPTSVTETDIGEE